MLMHISENVIAASQKMLLKHKRKCWCSIRKTFIQHEKNLHQHHENVDSSAVAANIKVFPHNHFVWYITISDI